MGNDNGLILALTLVGIIIACVVVAIVAKKSGVEKINRFRHQRK